MSKIVKMFTFAVVMSLVAGFLLTFASTALKDRQMANVKFDKQKKILSALALTKSDEAYTKDELMALYNNNVQSRYLTPDGDLVEAPSGDDDLPLFVVLKDEEIEKYAIHFEAAGLWSTMKGYFGLSGDGKSVIGFTVYSHAETPGLGAEVEKEWFANQFLGKSIVDVDDNFVSISVVKGGVAGKYSGDAAKNYIDSISGSTITSKGLENGLREELKKYEVLSSKLRS